MAVAGGLEIIHVPGHCVGQIAPQRQRHGGVLFVGDAASRMMGGLGLSIVNEHLAQHSLSSWSHWTLRGLQPGCTTAAAYRRDQPFDRNFLMNILILGATGATGQVLLDQALAAGHMVTAMARRPEMIALRHPRLRVLPGDVLVAESLHAAMAGQDAVLSALGTGTSRQPTTLYSQGVANIIAAMDSQGIRRLLCISSGGAQHDPGIVWWYRLFIKPLLQPVYDDMARMERLVRASSLDWTIVRPAWLRNGPPMGVYRLRVDRQPAGGWRIRRADVAEFILREVGENHYVCTAVGIAY